MNPSPEIKLPASHSHRAASVEDSKVPAVPNAILRAAVALAMLVTSGVLGLLVFATNAHAELSYSMESHAGITRTNLVQSWEDVYDSGNSTTAPFLSNAIFATGFVPFAGYAYSSANVTVGYGYLRMVTGATFIPEEGLFAGGGSVSASGHFEDSIIINAPGLTGTPGSFTPIFQAIVSGSNPFPNAYGYGASYGLSVTIGNQSASVGGSFDSSFGGGILPLNIGPVSFIYGDPFTISATASVYVRAGGTNEEPPINSGSVVASFPGSFHWLGMEGLAPGAAITQGAIDWSLPAAQAPIPEPSSLCLLALGSAILFPRRRPTPIARPA